MSFNITTYRYSCNFQMLPCEQIHAHPDQMSGKLHAWWESAAWTQTHSQRKTLRSGFSWSWERGSPLVLQLATVRSASALQLVTVSNRWAPESCEDIEVGPHQWQHFQRRGILNTSTITLSRSARQKSICHRTAMMINWIVYVTRIFVHWRDLTCKRGSVGQSEGLSIPRSSVRFRLKPDTLNSHEFELHRPSNKGTKLLLKVIKAIIIIKTLCLMNVYPSRPSVSRTNFLV